MTFLYGKQWTTHPNPPACAYIGHVTLRQSVGVQFSRQIIVVTEYSKCIDYFVFTVCLGINEYWKYNLSFIILGSLTINFKWINDYVKTFFKVTT